MWRGKHLSEGHATWVLGHLPTLVLRCAKVKSVLDLFGLNDKLLIHTVRTHVINYDCVFFVQNSCWGNRASSDRLQGGGTEARGFPAPRPHASGPLALGRKGARAGAKGREPFLLGRDGRWWRPASQHAVGPGAAPRWDLPCPRAQPGLRCCHGPSARSGLLPVRAGPEGAAHQQREAGHSERRLPPHAGAHPSWRPEGCRVTCGQGLRFASFSLALRACRQSWSARSASSEFFERCMLHRIGNF